MMLMNATRRQAEVEYKKALAATNAALKISESAWIEADAKLTVARRNLVEMEIAHPTAKETAKQNRLLYLRNRGLDV